MASDMAAKTISVLTGAGHRMDKDVLALPIMAHQLIRQVFLFGTQFVIQRQFGSWDIDKSSIPASCP
jgi:hypothetical protein